MHMDVRGPLFGRHGDDPPQIALPFDQARRGLRILRAGLGRPMDIMDGIALDFMNGDNVLTCLAGAIQHRLDINRPATALGHHNLAALEDCHQPPLLIGHLKEPTGPRQQRADRLGRKIRQRSAHCPPIGIRPGHRPLRLIVRANAGSPHPSCGSPLHPDRPPSRRGAPRRCRDA